MFWVVVVREKKQYHYINRGSVAINALNRFSQNNAPEMNMMLDARSRMASEAAQKIARRFVLLSHYLLKGDGYLFPQGQNREFSYDIERNKGIFL